MTMWPMRISRWVPRATDTHSEYAILISFLLEQWLHERASMLCSTYIAFLVISENRQPDGEANRGIAQENSR